MRIVNVKYADFFNATVVTPEMVVELASGLGMSPEAIAKLQKQQLNKTTNGRGTRSTGAGDCPDAKLRTVVLNKLSNENDLCSNFTHGNSFDFEFAHLADEQPEPDIGAAGQNTSKRAGGQRRNGKLQGRYVVVRKDGLRCTQESDPEKFALWQHVWNSGTFEQYFQNAPAKAVTRTGRIITASSEMLWAIKCGWVKPVAE